MNPNTRPLGKFETKMAAREHTHGFDDKEL